MQKFGKTIVTDTGRQMLTEVDGAKGKITYTKASICNQDIKNLSENECLSLTSLDGVQLDTELEVTDVRDTTVTVLASFNNATVTQDLAFNSIGWFAKTSVDDAEKLLAVTPSESEQTLVAGNSGASTSSIDIEMVFGRSHNTTVVVNPSAVGLVSKAQLTAVTDKINSDIAANKKEISDQLQDAIKDLHSIDNPDRVFTKSDTLDIDTFITPGIYSLKDPTVIASINPKALDAVPANKDGKTRCGYLIITQHDIYNVSQEIRIFNSNSYTVSHRFLFATNNFRPDFERVITTKDYQNIIGYIDGKETVHQCDDLTSGIAYSKANPNIIVATP